MLAKLKAIAATLSLVVLLSGLAFAQGESGKKTGKTATTAKTQQVDINSASKEELDALPGIGEAYSQKIIDGRPYHSKHDLVTKKIIPQSEYNKIKNQIVAHHEGEKSSTSKTPKASTTPK